MLSVGFSGSLINVDNLYLQPENELSSKRDID